MKTKGKVESRLDFLEYLADTLTSGVQEAIAFGAKPR